MAKLFLSEIVLACVCVGAALVVLVGAVMGKGETDVRMSELV